jgi:hypothetical protein
MTIIFSKDYKKKHERKEGQMKRERAARHVILSLWYMSKKEIKDRSLMKLDGKDGEEN